MYIEHEPGGCECSCCGAIFIGQPNDFLCKSCQDTAKKEQAMNARQEDAKVSPKLSTKKGNNHEQRTD